MNKQVFGSVLAMTAGMASQMAVISPAYAKAQDKAEAKFAKEFSLKLNARARAADENGVLHEGSIYLDIYQEEVKNPSGTNLLTGEMSGRFYFASEDKTLYVELAGEDGDILLDLVDRSDSRRTYQVYGCSSSLTQCVGDSFQVFFEDWQVSMNLNFSHSNKVEVQSTIRVYDQTGAFVEKSDWLSSVSDMPMTLQPAQK